MTCADGSELALPGRSLLFVRNVGHLMTNPAILLPRHARSPKAFSTRSSPARSARSTSQGTTRCRNSRCGSIYIVKPKMHGPEECAFTNDLFDAVEDLLGLARATR